MGKRTDEQKALDFEKVRRGCPCAFIDGNRYRYPSVDCELECGTCGWNPNEHKRRMENGATVYNRKTKIKTMYIRKGNT
jgi:hypothetical protein